jgi:hypothetical protein
MKKWIALSLLLVLALTACAGAAEESPEGLVTVYKLPT